MMVCQLYFMARNAAECVGFSEYSYIPSKNALPRSYKKRSAFLQDRARSFGIL